MSAGTVSTKGQVTLPIDLREKHGIKTHGRVVYIDTKEGILVRPARDIMEFAGIGKSKKKMTWDQETETAAKTLDSHVRGHRG